MTLLQISNISKKHDDGTKALHDIDLSINAFRKVAIVGETGSGKSTLLQIISGMLQPTSGVVSFENERVEGPEEKLIPGHPQIAYLSQYFTLPKFLKVEEFLEDLYVLSEDEAELIHDSCNIRHLLSSDSQDLSGGEKQRVALAKLLTRSPKLLLLDEPFSNLDPLNKGIIKSVIDDIGKNLQTTCALVAHDPSDVLSWADEVIVLKEGAIVQRDDPQTVYNKPLNEYVAGLFGRFNLINLENWQDLSDFHVLLEGSIMARPETLKLSKSPGNGVPGYIMKLEYFGGYEDALINAGDDLLIVRNNEVWKFGINERVTIELK